MLRGVGKTGCVLAQRPSISIVKQGGIGGKNPLAGVFGGAVFHVPFRGSVPALLVTSTAFLLASLGLGLFISSAVRVQFVAAQVSIVAGFLPAFFLSGLLFDLGSTLLVIRTISRLVPARYFVSISQTLFLAGDVWSVLLPNSLLLALEIVNRRSFAATGWFITIASPSTSASGNPWLHRDVFPNGLAPSAVDISRAAECLFVVEDWHNLGADYDPTLIAWHRNVEGHWPWREERYDERFRRL